MDIATNAVLLAVLADVSVAAKRLELPLPTPLRESNVVSFNATPQFFAAETYLSCYLVYQGGYEFWHEWGCVCGFSTPAAYTRMLGKRDGRGLFGEARYSEDDCVAKVRETVRRLGFTNQTVFGTRPRVLEAPTQWRAGFMPRYVLRWRGDDVYLECEVNANRLGVEFLTLAGPDFRRKPWPVTFGQTNVVEPEEPARPAHTEMAVSGVSREYAMSFVRAILPEVSRFCGKLGLPLLPSPITEGDLNLPESEVSLNHGRVLAALRLKSGHLVSFYAGHVWGVETEDAYHTRPGYRKKVRDSEEYRGPIRVSQREAVEKARAVLLERLGLPAKELFLDTEPVHNMVANPKATEGVRRFLFRWQRPETDAERAEREAKQFMPEITVTAEVDAVSGALKNLTFRHKFFERPDPVIAPPLNSPAGAPPP